MGKTKHVLLRIAEIILLVPAFGLLIPPVPSEEGHVYDLFPGLLFAVILFMLSQSVSIYRDRQSWWASILKLVLFVAFGLIVFFRVTMLLAAMTPMIALIKELMTVVQFIADALLAALPLMIGLIAVYIAYQQHKTNRLRLRNELYERRLRVYKVVQSFYSEVIRDGDAPWNRTAQFYADAAEAAFLFEPSIQEHIDLVYKMANKQHALHEELFPSDGFQSLPAGEKRSKVSKDNCEALKRLIDQLSKTKELFRKHM